MSTATLTLARRVSVTTPKGSSSRNDVVLHVVPTSRGQVAVTLDVGDTFVAVTLDEAERLSLIEALTYVHVGGRR